MPTRAELRRQLARDLGALGPLPTGPEPNATSGTITTLVQNTWPVKSSIAKNDEYTGWYLLRPSAAAITDRVRQINAGSYDPSTGTFTVDTAYTNAPVSGTGLDSDYELHGHGFHPWEGIDDLLNEGLKLIMVPVQEVYWPLTGFAVGSAGPTDVGGYVQNLTSGGGTYFGSTHTSIPSLLHSSWVTRLDLLPVSKQLTTTLVQLGATTGQYELSLYGMTSAAIAWNISASSMQSILRALPGLGEVTVSRSGSSGSYTYTVTLIGAPLDIGSFAITQDTYDGVLTQTFPTPADGPAPMTARLYMNGPDVLAEFNTRFAYGDRIYVSHLVRAYDWCTPKNRVFGSQSGLSLEGDEAVPVAEWVSLAAQIIAWQRAPKVMEEALEQRRVRALGDVIRNFRAYQDAYLRDVKRDRTLTYDVDGGVFSSPLPGDSAPLPESALASTVRRAPTAA